MKPEDIVMDKEGRMKVNELKFNEFGMIPDYPQELIDAQMKYWDAIKPYLDSLSMTEARAMLFYINMDCEMSRYLILRGISVRKARGIK